MMRKKSLSQKIKEAQELLEADNKQMARQLRLATADFEAIRNGARVLPLPVQKTLENRIMGLLDRCGLK
jgi:hypothetical protein